jgi:hypothetical protein
LLGAGLSSIKRKEKKMDFITWVQHTGVHQWLGETPYWFPYPFIIALHAMGMGVIVGMNVALDLRILGAAPSMPLAPMESFFPVMWFGFWVNAITGVGLMITHPELLLNWVMWVKLTCIVLAVVSLRLLRKQVFRDPNLDKGSLPMRVQLLAGASILFWAGAITAGRMTAYIGS